MRRVFRETERSNPDSSAVRAPVYVHMETEIWVRVPVWAFYRYEKNASFSRRFKVKVGFL